MVAKLVLIGILLVGVIALAGDAAPAGAGIGNPCTINPAGVATGSDTDADHLLDSCEAMAGTTVGDPDSDDDGVQDGVEVGTGTNPIGGSGYLAGVDTDGDGCLNELELAADDLDPSRDRHPGNWWDNWDVNGSGDVDLTDTLIVLSYFGMGYDDGEYDIPGGQAIDRDRLVSPGPPGLLVEGNRGSDLGHALQNLYQFGWGGCSAPGPVPPEGGGIYY